MGQQYSAAFKARVVQELLREQKTIAQIAAETGVHPNQLGKWKALAIAGLPSLFDRRDATEDLKAAHEQQLSDLYAEIGRLTTQLAWLKKKSGLEHVER
jgi:putative transposase